MPRWLLRSHDPEDSPVEDHPDHVVLAAPTGDLHVGAAPGELAKPSDREKRKAEVRHELRRTRRKVLVEEKAR